jgi:predicted cupin superfamily sugar epimerase
VWRIERLAMPSTTFTRTLRGITHRLAAFASLALIRSLNGMSSWIIPLPMTAAIEDLVQQLRLTPHPEGGFFRELHREPGLSTILYALPPSGLAPLHRLRTRVELWHFYAGAAVDLHVLAAEQHRIIRLSPAQPVGIVPAGAWQAARVVGAGAALVGCTVAPAFSFDDWEMPSRQELLATLPFSPELIAELTRP